MRADRSRCSHVCACVCVFFCGMGVSEEQIRSTHLRRDNEYSRFFVTTVPYLPFLVPMCCGRKNEKCHVVIHGLSVRETIGMLRSWSQKALAPLEPINCSPGCFLCSMLQSLFCCFYSSYSTDRSPYVHTNACIVRSVVVTILTPREIHA